MPKLLQINATANWGSTGKIAEGIGLVAQKDGWESAIAYGRYMNPSKSRLFRVGDKKDVLLHYAYNRLLDGEGLIGKPQTRRLIDQIKDYNPDIIHLHNIHDHWLHYPTLFKYLDTVDTPIVWTFHDCWAFTGGCGYFDSVNCYEWKRNCGNCPYRKGKIDRTARNLALKRDLITPLLERMVIVPVSQWLANICRDSYFGDTKIELIHNGIDINTFVPTVKNTKQTVIGVALPWSKRKGLEDMVALRTLLPKDEFDIVMVGVSAKQLKELPTGIIGIERTHNVNELANLYGSSTVFVNPTYSDNFPTVNIEALACGTPVITYRTGGSPEAVDASTGIVVERGNVNELATAVISLANNTKAFPADACRIRAEKNFNKEIQFRKYLNIYNQLLKKQ